MPFCTHCGHETPEGSLFCETCGARQDDAAQPAAPMPEEPSPGAAPPPSTPPDQGSESPVQPAYGGEDAADQPPCAYGQPSDAPVYGQPSDAPVYGQPSDAPVYGQPSDAPVYGQPSDAPAYGQPADAPAYGQPSDAPVYGQPSDAPVYGQPSDAPAYGQPADAPAYGQPAAAAAPKPRKPLPKNVKIGIVAAAALIVVFAAVCLILNKVNDPKKTIKTFVNSIITRDAGSFRSVTVCAAPDIKITEESVLPFLNLYAKNTAMLNTFQDALTADLQLLEQGMDTTGNGLVRLVRKDHVIFKSYSVELSTVKATFTSPLPNAKATVAGKTLELPVAGREYSVNILPGRYEVEATATDSTFGSTFTYENNNLKVGASGITSALEFEYATVILTRQELEPTSLTVNGKSCPIPAFDDFGTAFLSPLPVDAQLTATFDYSGVVFSASFTCDGPNQRYFYLDPVLDPDSARTLLNTAADFTNDWLQRYADGDAGGIQALCGGQSSLLSALAYQLRNSQKTDSWRYAYHYTLRELEGDLELERINDLRGDNVPCFSTLLFLGLDYTREYLAPVSNDPGQQSEPEAFNESIMVKVNIQYKDGGWQVVSYDRAYNTSRSDISSPCALM